MLNRVKNLVNRSTNNVTNIVLIQVKPTYPSQLFQSIYFSFSEKGKLHNRKQGSIDTESYSKMEANGTKKEKERFIEEHFQNKTSLFHT